MALVNAKLLSPDGELYRVQINDEADDDKILETLVDKLGLPVKSSPAEEYVLFMVNALKLKDGVTLILKERNTAGEAALAKRAVVVG